MEIGDCRGDFDRARRLRDGPGRRTRPAIGRPRRGTVDSLGAVALEPEAELHAHLKMRHLAVGHMAADVGDLEPFDMAQALAGGADRLFHGIVDALAGRAVDFGDGIDM